MNITRLTGIFCVPGLVLVMAGTANATNVTYDFSGTCAQYLDCGPLGVLDVNVGPVTGTMELNLLEPTVAQLWDSSTVLSYSFTFGNFTIDDTNSTLSNASAGNIPFTTSASAPFILDDGFMVARYDLDNSVFLNITLGGVNLVQGSETGCGGSCQALATGSWTRVSAVPVPAAIWLFGSGLLALFGLARPKTIR